MIRNIALAATFAFAAWIAPVSALEIGAWVGGPAGVAYPQPSQTNVDAFEALQGRHLDYISVFVVWDSNDWNWTKPYADVASANGSKLLVTWMANGYNLDKIIAGAADGYLRKYASAVKSYGKEVWMRPLHEANANWYSWGVSTPNSNNSEVKCVEAWKHIVQIFRDSSVTNVKWVWTTNATSEGAGTSLMGAYPGDDWVDYNSIDGYNWGTAQSWSSWKSFEEVFAPAYTLLAAQSKPIFIAEFSSSEHGGNKAQWISDMFSVLPARFPKIFALMWFSQSKSAEADWAVDTSPESLNAWKMGIAAASTNLRALPRNFSPVHLGGASFDLLGRLR